VISGGDLLSSPTSLESEFMASEGAANERLACQTRVDRIGEVHLMTKQKKSKNEEAEVESDEAYRKRFAEMPLDKKIAELVKLEALTVSDTLTYVANSPYKVAEKVMDVMAGFGFKAEQEKRSSARPEEHRENGSSDKTKKA
jgi:hypothetical protein